MADWSLVPCLVQLRIEFNRIAPGRDKASDGSIGDTAHQQEVSDHNDDEAGSVPIHDADKLHEVHALDVDADLGEPGLSMETVVQYLLGRCRSGAETRLRYIIYNRRIWEASNGWREVAYHGASPHTEHAHFSASYDTAREANTASWHLEDIPVALTTADKQWLSAEIRKVVTADADPGPRSYSLGGLATAAETRTNQLANTDMPEVKEKLADLERALTEIKALLVPLAKPV